MTNNSSQVDTSQVDTSQVDTSQVDTSQVDSSQVDTSQVDIFLADIDKMSVEIHSLIHQGVKALSIERIEHRQQKIEQLFAYLASQGFILTAEQQRLLQNMVDLDQRARGSLEAEQQAHHGRNKQKNRLNLYQQNR